MRRYSTASAATLLCAAALALPLAGCGSGDGAGGDPPVETAQGDGQLVEDDFWVKFETTKGDFTVAVHPEWAPRGATRFHELVESKYYDGCRFFRVLPGFMVQWGISGDPVVAKTWKTKTIRDDPVVKSNTRGKITFAMAGPNTRTSQVFVNFGDNSRLDGDGFAPFGEVVEGMDVVDSINAEYRERPEQDLIHANGNKYLMGAFPNLDYIGKATIVEEPTKPENAKPDDAESDDPEADNADGGPVLKAPESGSPEKDLPEEES